LSQADVLVLGEVYPAGESPIEGADSRSLSRAIRVRGQVDPIFVEPLEDLPEVLRGLVRPGDILLVLGAGDIGSVAAALPQQLAQNRGIEQ
jgi:UDP-N-acetylmuramate--alanine ligase